MLRYESDAVTEADTRWSASVLRCLLSETLAMISMSKLVAYRSNGR